jgi:hypothetical protein
MSGEDYWKGLGALDGPTVVFGPQGLPPEEDVAFSRQDTAFGWDQALTMDRAMVDGFGRPTQAAAAPAGIAIARDSVYLNLERNQGNDSAQESGLLLLSSLAERFNSPLALIEWAPNTEVIHAGGYTSVDREDVLPQVAKALPDYYYGVIDGQAILDEAIARTRRAMYGR